MEFVDTFVGKCNGAQARRGVRGPPGPTIIIIKEIIRFNNKKTTKTKQNTQAANKQKKPRKPIRNVAKTPEY